MSWICKTCGEEHDDIPLSFAADYPDNYASMRAEDREARTLIGSDQCMIDEKEFYIRGCLEIPIKDSDQIFLWGVWASLSQEDYDEIGDCWNQEGREHLHGPFKGRLANTLRVYPVETSNLKLTVRLSPVGARPLFFIEELEHPMAIAQKDGITLEQAHEIAAKLLHS